MRRLIDGAFRALFRIYRWVISPALHLLAGAGAGCRHSPSCSAYAERAISEHGVLHGGRLALARLLRCHPFARGEFEREPG